MGRRSQHKPDELRELILDATRQIIETAGVQEVSAREIARAVGYAPGTLYNMFANLDDILFHVEARFLDDLDQALQQAMNGRKGLDALCRFAAAYATFVSHQPLLWNLIQVHHPADRRTAPDWYLEKVYAPVQRLEPIIAKMIDSRDPDEITRTARLLWSSVHGVLQVATTAKFGRLPTAASIAMVENVVQRLFGGHSPARIKRSTDGHNRLQPPDTHAD